MELCVYHDWREWRRGRPKFVCSERVQSSAGDDQRSAVQQARTKLGSSKFIKTCTLTQEARRQAELKDTECFSVFSSDPTTYVNGYVIHLLERDWL